MARSLDEQADDLDRAMAELVVKYQFRDRHEIVAYGLSVSQAYGLRALGDGAVLSMGEIAATLRLSVSAATRMIDQLVAKKLIDRVRDDADRRICRVTLTAAGRRVWRSVRDELVASDREVLRRIAPSERETVIRAIRELSLSVDEWRGAQKAKGRGSP